MKYVDEFRDAGKAKKLIEAISQSTSKTWSIMEICGGQTHAILRYGLDQLLPPEITLVHGPGCPVCVTSISVIDNAIFLAQQENIIFTTFGDMLRVPGSNTNLLAAKARGADVRMVYSPIDAVNMAVENPDKEIVFFAVGFETTAPTTALATHFAKSEGVENFSLLVSHVRVPPAMEAILSAPNNSIDGFLAAGHVCAVMGTKEYEPIADKYQIPVVVTGFEPIDMLDGVLACIRQLEEGRYSVENRYERSVQGEGNEKAQELMQTVFRVASQDWRGIGSIDKSGLMLSDDYRNFDAAEKFSLSVILGEQSGGCISGEILQGYKKPHECPSFGGDCTPEHPLGAPMVSAEGACSAYYRYRKHSKVAS